MNNSVAAGLVEIIKFISVSSFHLLNRVLASYSAKIINSRATANFLHYSLKRAPSLSTGHYQYC